MKKVTELFKGIRFELFTVRPSALAEDESEMNLKDNVYQNNDEDSLEKDLNDPEAKKLADLAIFK